MLKSSNFSLLIFAVSLILICVFPVFASAEKAPAFKVKCRAAVLINAVSGQIIFEQNPDRLIPPASLTKIMTLNLAFDAVDEAFMNLDDEVRVSKKAWKTKGSRMFLEVGKTVRLETLLKGIAVVSANDACVAISEYIAGVEEVFVDRMNEKAEIIGMKNTFFKNSHGFPAEGQITTAHDMALLSLYYLSHHPEVLQYHSVKKMTFNNITQPNRNGLLWLDYGVDGLKTGWFSDAGFHIIATAPKDGDRFIAVVMGCKSETERENTALKLLNYGFRNFITTEVLTAGKELAKVSVWKGKERELPLGILKSASITVPRDEKGEIQIIKKFPERIYAPIEKGQMLGEVKILLYNRVIDNYPLVALTEIKKAGFFKLMMHKVLLLIILPPYWGIIVLVLFFLILFIFVKSSLRVRGRDELTRLR